MDEGPFIHALFLIFQHCQTMLQILHITFIFDECHQRSAVVTPVIHICDSKNLNGTFARSNILLMEILTNGALVTPTEKISEEYSWNYILFAENEGGLLDHPEPLFGIFCAEGGVRWRWHCLLCCTLNTRFTSNCHGTWDWLTTQSGQTAGYLELVGKVVYSSFVTHQKVISFS